MMSENHNEEDDYSDPSNRNKNKTIMEDYDSVKQENLIPLVTAVRAYLNNTLITPTVQPV